MDQAQLQSLKRRFDTASWPAPPSADTRLPVSAEDFARVAGEGWRPERSRVVAFAPDVRQHKAILLHGKSLEDEAFGVEAFECPTPAAARDTALNLLGEFQGPVQRDPAPVAGELSFSLPGGTFVLFVRANLVLLLRNAGRKVLPVVDLAKALDRHLQAASAPQR